MVIRLLVTFWFLVSLETRIILNYIILYLSWKGIAAEVANKINAKYLILNHFSQRYKPVDFFKEKSQDEKEKLKDQMLPEDEDEDNVQKLVDEVKLVYKGPVQAAYDFFSFKV